MTEHTTRRGRPPSPATAERARRVLYLLNEHGPMTRAQLAAALGEEPVRIWLSLDRLRGSGLVKLRNRRVKGPGGRGTVGLWSVSEETS